MFILISYDITDDKRRLHVARELENFGIRVQYSVFEANLDKKKFDELKKLLIKYIDEKEDSVRFYNLCDSCVKKIKIIGVGEITKDEDFYIV